MLAIMLRMKRLVVSTKCSSGRLVSGEQGACSALCWRSIQAPLNPQHSCCMLDPGSRPAVPLPSAPLPHQRALLPASCQQLQQARSDLLPLAPLPARSLNLGSCQRPQMAARPLLLPD